MNSPAPDVRADLLARLARLRAAHENDPYPTAAVRIDRLRRAVDVLIKNEKRISDTINADFAGRPEPINLLVDVMAPVRTLKYSLKHVERWMRPEKRKPEFPMGLIGGRAGVFHQPLGVVGKVSPWNAPVALAFSPLGSILAAGNRAFLKPSELVPQTADLIAAMVREAFNEDEVDVVTGGIEVSQAFTAVPFDHLVFTGGAGTARHVLRAAAENLVPVTLELGGKSPCIVVKGADLKYAAAKFINGKTTNAGQVCMAPDFAYVQASDTDAFVGEVKAALQRMHPQYAQGPDFTHVHLDRQRSRLAHLVADAAQRGAQVEVLDGTPIDQLATRDPFPPVLVINPPLDAALMHEEIFGPIIPVVSYDTLQGAAKVLAKLSRPLAMYFIGGSEADRDFILKNTYAGGISFNDVMLHPFMQDVPFGGVGESGMGRYLAYDGFKTMSNGKGYAVRPWFDVTKYIAPPYGAGLANAMRKALKL